MNLKFCAENTLPPHLLKEGIKFIRRRFQEVWGIYRTDVTYDLVLRRKNIVLFDNSKIVGWLGIESDGELTNACIEKKYGGGNTLIGLIEKAYRSASFKYMYANVPIKKTASARAFLTSGMQLEKAPYLTKLIYPEKEVIVVRLSIDLMKDRRKEKDQNSIEKDIERIRELNYVFKDMPVYIRKF